MIILLMSFNQEIAESSFVNCVSSVNFIQILKAEPEILSSWESRQAIKSLKLPQFHYYYGNNNTHYT